MAALLDLTSLENAVNRLREGLRRYEQDESDEQIRDGLILRFEFTYELSHKMLKRFLVVTAASPGEVEDMVFADLIRTGNERGLLLGDWPTWKSYRDMRGSTSHTYDAEVAANVVKGIPAFLEEADYLLSRLKERV